MPARTAQSNRMRALLDINVLIALLDADHASHDVATQWYATHVGAGWASCPITQNGCVRIMSHPRYASPLPASLVVARLAEACGGGAHEFWADEVSLLDPEVADRERIHGPRAITDLYLLALAVRRGGRLVTFDRGIAPGAVKGAEERHLLKL
jgi:toxin-antitoxin system PIN domain toxin